MWHEAGINALVLTAICIAYTLINNALAAYQSVWIGLLTFLLEAGKIFGCIYFMRLFMYRFKENHKAATRTEVRRYGTIIGLLSGLLFSALTMIYLIWNPESTQEAINSAMAALEDQMDRNSLIVMDTIIEYLPQITFVSNFIYCALWAYILPSILAPKLVSDNPFDSDEEDDE